MAEHLIAPEDAGADILACAAFIAAGIKSSDGYADAMKAIVPLYLEKDEVDMAAELANTIDDPYSRDRLLTMVAERCAALDDDEYAFQLAEAIEDDGLQAQAREKIALQKSAKGEFGKANDIAAELDHPDYVYADIAVQHWTKGEKESAEGSLALIRFPAAEVFALQAMAAVSIQSEKNADALELLERGAEAATEIEHDEERIRAFADTANLFREAKRNDRAIEVYDTVKTGAEELDNIHRDFFLATAAIGFLQAGSVELADRALDLMQDKTQTASCLVGYAREFWRREDKAEAMEALDEAHAILKSEKEKETRDSRAKNALFTSIAVQYAAFDKPERALEIAQENQSEEEQYSGLAQIAQVLEIKGNDEGAHQAIKAIGDDVNRMFGLVGLSGAAERAGNKEKALDILQEASTMVETIHQLSSRSSVYNELAGRFAALGETTKAREISLENLGVIEQIRDDSIRAVSLAGLAAVYHEADFEVEEAETKILGKMAGRMEW